jgi:L-threonylcarbamoyladenylate synthase
MVIDGGECDIGIESTVLSLVHPSPTILRHGAVTKEQLTAALGRQIFELTETEDVDEVHSPGMHPLHYAPDTRVMLRNDFDPQRMSGRIGLISFRAYEDELGFDFAAVTCLSSTCDLHQVAHRLFAALRDMDALDLDSIVIDTCDTRGLGRAIMDRVVRATRQKKAQ